MKHILILLTIFVGLNADARGGGGHSFSGGSRSYSSPRSYSSSRSYSSPKSYSSNNSTTSHTTIINNNTNHSSGTGYGGGGFWTGMMMGHIFSHPTQPTVIVASPGGAVASNPSPIVIEQAQPQESHLGTWFFVFIGLLGLFFLCVWLLNERD